MKTLILSCPTLEGELNYLLKKYDSDAKAIYLSADLHSQMHDISPTLQSYIDKNSIYDRIIVLLSGCGGSTAGLFAGTAELVIPRTRDCIDILLSSGADCSIPERDPMGIYMTASWYDYHMQTVLNADKLIKEVGYEEAAARLRKIFRTINRFYIIDTQVYNLERVKTGLASLIKILDGSLKIVPGPCGILERVAANKITDKDFYITPKGSKTGIIPFRLG